MTKAVADLALLVAEHASDTSRIAGRLCEVGDVRVASRLAVRADTPLELASALIEDLWGCGFADVDAWTVQSCRTRVASEPSLRPELQLRVVAYADRHTGAVARHATDPRVLGAMLAAVAANPSPEPLWDPSTTDRQRIPAAGAGPVHALLTLVDRVRDEPALVPALHAAGMTAAVCAVVAADTPGVARDAAVGWGRFAPEEVCAAAVESGRGHLVCATGAMRWATPAVRSTMVDWACDHIRTGRHSHGKHALDGLYQAWGHLPADEADRVRSAVRSTADIRDGRRAWLRQIAVSDEERDAAGEVALWSSRPLVDAVAALDVLSFRLPQPAAEAFVARADVGTELAFKVAMASSHLWDGWVRLRPDDRAFLVKYLARLPGRTVDVDADLLVEVVTEAVRSGTEHAVRSLAEAWGHVCSPVDYLSMPWGVLAEYRAHDPAAATALADALVPVLADPATAGVLERVLAEEWSASMRAADVLDAVAAATTA